MQRLIRLEESRRQVFPKVKKDNTQSNSAASTGNVKHLFERGSVCVKA